MTDFWMTDAWMAPAWVVCFSTMMTLAFWKPAEDRVYFWCAAAGTLGAALYTKAFCGDGS